MVISNDADSINEAIREPAPELRPQERLIVELQRGVVDPASGIWYTDAEVREMTGADEEYLSGIDSKNNLTYSDYMVALLKRATTRIGTIVVSDKPSVIETLSVGDRDILFLGVIRATYGSSKDFQATCPHCSEDNDVTMNLNEDFPIQDPGINLQEPISVQLRNGQVVRMRVPTTGDSSFVGKKSQSPAVQNTLMISKCVVWDSGDAPRDTEAWAKSLNIADRNKLVKALLDIKAGPKLEAVNVQCAHCSEDMTIRIDWISLLFS